MPPRTAKHILAEWHDLAMRQEEAIDSDDTDSDVTDGIAARIDQLRREYIEGTPPDVASSTQTAVDNEPKVQMKLPL